ncbi:DEAD/DEAH box helicase [Rothia nasisuis]|uniref:DEAD/DEAH box helicase n=1 Tax=Rothia nasisuis TaxID=2109647 RepID=UPI001F333AFF|nr:DNA helicase [Rothia nasisuis]
MMVKNQTRAESQSTSVNEQVAPESERHTHTPEPQQSPAYPAVPVDTVDSEGLDAESAVQVHAGLEAWAEQMEIYTGPDAMLDFNQVDYVHLDLTDANASGVAQMFMGRKTRLSTILRDKAKLEAGMVAARTLRTKIFELASGHGLDAGYFVAGTASWLSRSVREDGLVGEKRFIAPILMAPLALTPHPSSDDFEVQLTGPAQLNPAMVRQIKKEYGIDLGTMDVAQLANSMRRLDPEPVIERMRATTGEVPGMTIHSTYLISTFADLKESTGELPATAHTALVRELAQLKLNPLEQPFVAPIYNTRESLDSRDPDTDMLVVDADSSGQEIVDLAHLGHSFTVTAAPGTDQLGAATNLAAALISQGKSVLVVGEKRSTLADFSRLLERTHLTDLTFNLLADKHAEEYRRELIAAISRNEKAPAPNVTEVHRELVATRNQLRAHTESLRFTESRWGCSVYDALQTLAALTAQDPAPSTHVRLSQSTMDALTHRAETVARLQRLGELGGYRPSTRASAWHRAKLTTGDDTAAAHSLVKSLRFGLDRVSAQMRLLSGTTGMRLADTMEEWGQQLDLLTRIAETLTRFRPEIFDRPVTDLIAATASGAWRREHGIEMSSVQRSRLRRAAKEYIVPGVTISDLHESLFIVQEQREEWVSWVTDERVPTVPHNLEQLHTDLLALHQEFAGLAIVLEDSPAGTDFARTSLGQLENRLVALIDDDWLLHTLPERVSLMEELTAQGLGEFIEDLYERQLTEEHVAAELELAWWQTALEMMLASQELEILGGAALRDLETRFRRADYSHIASAPARLHATVADTWRRRISDYEQEAAFLRSQLRSHEFNLAQVLEQAPTVATTLLPLWVASPFSLSGKIPTGMRFDAAILLDAESTPLAANLPALIRAEQVIALGDPHSGFPAPFMVSAVAHNAPVPRNQKIVSTFEALSKVLPGRSLSTVNRAVDPALFGYLNEHFYEGALTHYPWGEEITDGVPALTVEYLDVAGRVSDNASLDSPSPEVQRVAELVIEHAYRSPQQSLAVVTTTARHAQRIAEAVRQLLDRYPQFAPFFVAKEEPFRVVDVSRAVDMERDVIIFALGAGKSAQGAAHRFGYLSERNGRSSFVLAVTRARHLTRLVTCVTPEDLDPQRLEYGAFDLYRLLLAYRKEQEAHADRKRTQTITGQLLGNDFLTNDNLEAIDMGDWLLSDVVRRLNDHGVTLHESNSPLLSLIVTGEAESLNAGAVASPRTRRTVLHDVDRTSPVRVPLALISDGSDAYAALTVRERSRLIPELLARTGWNHLSCWTIEVFTDPEAVVGRITSYLGIGQE